MMIFLMIFLGAESYFYFVINIGMLFRLSPVDVRFSLI